MFSTNPYISFSFRDPVFRLALSGVPKALLEEPRVPVQLPLRVPQKAEPSFAVRLQLLLQAKSRHLLPYLFGALSPDFLLNHSVHLFISSAIVLACGPIPKVLERLPAPLSLSSCGHFFVGPLAYKEVLLLCGEGHLDHALRIPASHQPQWLADALSLNPYSEAGGAAPDLHRELHSPVVLHLRLSFSCFLLTLHGPFKRLWKDATSPDWAMLRAGSKMARSGHTGQEDVTSGLGGPSPQLLAISKNWLTAESLLQSRP